MDEMDPSEFAGRRVLVTGGAGFIGSHIADALVEATDVIVFDDLSTGSLEDVPDEAELIVGDVRDPETLAEAMAGVDVVFHEAALVSVETSVEDPERTQAINADATIGVLERARREDARVVVASSAAVYGQPERVPIPEDAPLRPTSPYGLAKMTADQYVRVYADLYELPAVALRYFNVYGPRQTGEYAGVISVFVDQALSGTPLTVHGDGSQTRDFVHVRDVVRANLLAATRGEPGAAYNVGTGDGVSIQELAERVRASAGADVPITHTEGRDGDVERSRADVGRLARLGYEPTVDLDEGLEDFVESRPS